MILPRVKVALLSGADRAVMRSAKPLRVTFRNGESQQFIQQLTICPENSVPALLQSWYWYGNTRDNTLKEQLRAKGGEVLLSPVGLTPHGEVWQPRSYRLLVKAAANPAQNKKLIAAIKQVLPKIEPIEVELPEKNGTGELRITDSSGHNITASGQVEIQSDAPIELVEALIGQGFHWEHCETLQFDAPFWAAIGTDGKLCAGADIAIEDYLASVNSSEMPADSPLEFLKAQVVAARSWLLANWGSHHPGEPYTICGGDHCQCYYGLSRLQETSIIATNSTAGEVLLADGLICDARYAKTCGGVTEPARNVWHFVDEAYLTHLRDLPDDDNLDLSQEEAFRQFQNRSDASTACCAPGYAPLTGKLTELANLYRWKQEFSAVELGEIIRLKTGNNLGNIQTIQPLKRGPSGRLIEVQIVGELGALTLSPELRIRYALSRTHLPSSAFGTEVKSDGRLALHGLGWGHGVGMCQMGAAALALRGSDYRAILRHYFPGTSQQKIY